MIHPFQRSRQLTNPENSLAPLL